jgi:hypothetical protein
VFAGIQDERTQGNEIIQPAGFQGQIKDNFDILK